MRILSPVDNLVEVDALAAAGANEVYGGYVPGAWSKRYSMLASANQRYFPGAQIKSARELSAVVKAAHRNRMSFFLTLNAPYYTASQYDALVEDARRVQGMGADAFIVSDLGLMLRLKDRLPDAHIHLSTLQGVFNADTVGFFKRLGIDRMVFPRELTLSEMAGIVKASPDVEFDAFIMVGKCPNIEGFCTFTHVSPDLIWPCEKRYAITPTQPGGRSSGIVDAQSGWSSVNRRHACGLCGLPGLKKAGVTALKIVGRGGPTAVKVKVISAVRHALSLLDSDAGGTEYSASCKEIYRATFGCDCNAYVCYFPELWRAAAAAAPPAA